MDIITFRQFTEMLTASVAADERVHGLVALGSMAEQGRTPDAWSDHDFFLVVDEGAQEAFRQSLDWLPDTERIVLSIRETEHGLKVFYDMPHLIEFAVFSPAELYHAKVNDYRILLDRSDIAAQMRSISIQGPHREGHPQRDLAMVLALLYVGAGRYARGEKLSAHMFIRQHALQHLLPLLLHLNQVDREPLDNLDPFRRVEQSLPGLAADISAALARPLPECSQALLSITLTQAEDRLPGYPSVMAALVRDYLAQQMPG